MSDGVMILLVFALIALLGGGTTALVLLIARQARARKERAYTAETVGTVVRVRPGGVDRPTVVYVRYEVDGVSYECHETVKLSSELIRLGPRPHRPAQARQDRLARGQPGPRGVPPRGPVASYSC